MKLATNPGKDNISLEANFPNNNCVIRACSSEVELHEYWEDRDRRSLPFTNFMRLVLLYQINNGLTSNAMANELGMESKTYSAWIQCINSESVLDELLSLLDGKPDRAQSVGLIRLKETLLVLRGKVDRTSIPSQRNNAGLPSDKVFSEATEKAGKEIFLEYASSLKLPRDTPVAMAAKEIAAGLYWAYTYSPARDIPLTWTKLLDAISAVSRVAVERGMLKAMTGEVGNSPFDRAKQAQLEEIEKSLGSKIKESLRLANNYMQAIEQVALEEDVWSEKAAALYPVLPSEPAPGSTELYRLQRKRLEARIYAAAEAS